MSKRLLKLKKEIAPWCEEDISYINSKTIKKAVNDRLNAVPSERRIYMRQKLFKCIAALCIAAAMATSVSAMYNIDLLKQFFEGDTTQMQNFVETPEKAISDGDFEVSLNKTISTSYSLKAIFSVEALNDKAKLELGNERFDAISEITADYVNSSEGHHISSWGGKELKEYRTDNTKVWELSVEAPHTEKDGERIKLQFNFLNTDDNIIYAELKTDIETIEYTLQSQDYGAAIVKINPMSIIMTKGFPTTGEWDLYDTNAYFRMADGSIKTFNQLFDTSSATLVKEGKEYNMYEIYADSHNIIDLASLKSIILDGIEYSMENTADYKKIDDDELMKTFELPLLIINNEWYLPFDEAADKMGVEVTDGKFEFNGNKYELTEDGDIIKNNDSAGILEKAVIDHEGEKYIRSSFFEYIFYTNISLKESVTAVGKKTVTVTP